MVYPILQKDSKMFDKIVMDHGWSGSLQYKQAKEKLKNVICDDSDECIYFKGDLSMMKFDYDDSNADIANYLYFNPCYRVDLKTINNSPITATMYNTEKHLLGIKIMQKTKIDDMEYPVYFKNIETLIYNLGECVLNH